MAIEQLAIIKHGRRYFVLKGLHKCPECEADLTNNLGVYFVGLGLYELNCPVCECAWHVSVDE